MGRRHAPAEIDGITKDIAPIMDTKPPESSPVAARKMAWRKSLVEKRQNLADRAWRNDLLQRVMRVWLIHRPDTVIGAYWPIKGEFDPLPALFRWQEAGLEEDAASAARQRGATARGEPKL